MRDAAAEQDCHYMLLCHELSRINKNVARVAIMPARRRVGDDQQGDDAIPGARPVQAAPKVVGLMPLPTTLHDLLQSGHLIRGVEGRHLLSTLVREAL